MSDGSAPNLPEPGPKAPLRVVGRESAEDLAVFRAGQICGNGRYEVLRLISSGGFGEVYEVVDRQENQRRALKLMKAEHGKSADKRRRMLNEARTGMELVHPNLVKVFDVGVDEKTKLLYLVMELLEGRTMLELFHFFGRVPILQAIDWFVDIARGVHFLNEQGVVHRDLKPENVFVTKAGVVKILDLGNIRINRVGFKTTKGPQAGTVLYMSPEQLWNMKADRRADVYALALMVYEGIAGVHPLMVDVEEETVTAIMVATWHLQKDVPPLPRVAPFITKEMWALLRPGLSRDRESRCASAADFADSLLVLREMALQQDPSLERPSGERASRLALVDTEQVGPTGASTAPTPAPARVGSNARAAMGTVRMSPVASRSPPAFSLGSEPPGVPAGSTAPAPASASGAAGAARAAKGTIRMQHARASWDGIVEPTAIELPPGLAALRPAGAPQAPQNSQGPQKQGGQPWWLAVVVFCTVMAVGVGVIHSWTGGASEEADDSEEAQRANDAADPAEPPSKAAPVDPASDEPQAAAWVAASSGIDAPNAPGASPSAPTPSPSPSPTPSPTQSAPTPVTPPSLASPAAAAAPPAAAAKPPTAPSKPPAPPAPSAGSRGRIF